MVFQVSGSELLSPKPLSSMDSWQYLLVYCPTFVPKLWDMVNYSNQNTQWNITIQYLFIHRTCCSICPCNYTARFLRFNHHSILARKLRKQQTSICSLMWSRIKRNFQWQEGNDNKCIEFWISLRIHFKLFSLQIFLLGILQTIVETVMYIFVFLWTPVLMPAEPPLGMVFACFMVAIMIGSSIYTILLAKGYKAEQCLRIILITIASSMLVCCLTASPNRSTIHMILIYGAFLVLEIALGMYFPAMSYLKRYVRIKYFISLQNMP